MRRLLTLAVAMAVLAQIGPVAAAPPGTYANAVSWPVADTFADPTVIRGKDGWWYAYGTSDPLREGERTDHLIPIMRSADLVRWEHRGDVFHAGNRPSWARATSGLWAPDIRYVDGRYLLYFTVTDTTLNAGDDSAIGVATAPTPTGPWTDSGGPVVAPRPDAGGGYQWTFDPALTTDAGGRHWLYYGSYVGGVFAVALTADGLRTAGAATQVAIANRYEGSYVVRRGGWYYLFGSSANCCAGPTTGYSVFAGRSRQPAGPFVDRAGIPLLASRVGGTPVLQPNGNAWIGTGHNAVVTDVAGQDWLAYHAINRADPYLDEPYGINERPMLLDRLDWIDGWPVVRAGAGASEGRQSAPIATGLIDDRFERAWLGPGWRPASGWSVVPGADPDSGGLMRHTADDQGVLASTRPLPPNVHLDVDLRIGTPAGSAGVALGSVTVRVDRAANALVTDAGGKRRTPLPASFRYDAWHSLTVRIVGTTLAVTLTDARLADPVAEQVRTLPRTAVGGRLALIARGMAEFDNISAAPAARPRDRVEPFPRIGRLDTAHSDEFDGALASGWTWIRSDPAATVSRGALRWPTQGSDLVGGTTTANVPLPDPAGMADRGALHRSWRGSNVVSSATTASVLLRDPPRGDYVVETRLAIDLGIDTVRNFQQAGLIAYAGDDDFARLSHVAIWNTRQVEYGRELPFAGRLSFGGMVLTAPADTTWLRLAHSTDRTTGEHGFRAAVSRDGAHWVWGGTWTFPASTTPRIGLVSHGGATPPATAVFDYFRVYR